LILFDVRTLLITVALATLICAGARVLLWRLHPAIPGLGAWALASVMGAVALGLIAARGAIPEIFSLTLAQVLITVAFIVAWSGFRAFLDLPELSIHWRLLLLLGPVLLIALAQAEHSLPLRSISNALVISGFSGLIAFDLFRGNARQKMSMRITSGLYLLNALFFLVRAVAVESDSATISQMQSSGFAVFSLMWWLCFVMATTLCMVLMTSEILQENLDRQASLDPLTGAMNRRAFSHLSVRELARARRGGLPLTVVMMDLDHFKRINDRLGHATGDIVLRLFVSVAQRVLRTEDIFCRWGGEEFVTLLPATALPQALLVAERLRQSFAEEAADLAPEAAEIGFTVSLGLAQLRGDEEIEDLLRRADHALYRAKDLGRNRCEMAA
jgi:diguanylate cyclase (GGDEF)-like protein